LKVAQVRRLLGISSRYQMDDFLKDHGALLALSLDEVARDADTAMAYRSR
jgi:hypothetical protein